MKLSNRTNNQVTILRLGIMSKATKVRFAWSNRLLKRNKVSPPHEIGGGTLPSFFAPTRRSVRESRCLGQIKVILTHCSSRSGHDDLSQAHLKLVFGGVKHHGFHPPARRRQPCKSPLNGIMTTAAINLSSNQTAALIPHAWPLSCRKYETSRTDLPFRSESPIGPRRTNLTSEPHKE